MSKPANMDAPKMKEGSLGLSYPMLARNNYTAWSLKMKVFMQAQGVWEAIEADDLKEKIETRVDKVALAAIYQGIPEDMLLSVAEKRTAKEAWDAIKTMCVGADRVKKAKVQTLRAELESLCMTETEQLDDFCMKLYGIVTNIRVLGETMEESYVVKKLLRAVPSKYLQIASTIEQFGNLEEMTVEETVGRLKAHEERIRGSTEVKGGQLLMTEGEWLKTESHAGELLLTREEWAKRANKSGIDQKGKRDSSSRGGRDRSRIRCFNCNILGHYASECRKPKRDKEPIFEANLTQVDVDEPTLLLTECGEEERNVVLLNEGGIAPKLKSESEKKTYSNLWYLDNGASNHMTGLRSKFHELDENVTGQVKFGDGSIVHIKGKGSVVFECENGEKRVLREVYFIPSLCSNIISLGQLS